ncbi:MAG: adenylate/guanylate cyclase domain-containing protein [Parvularculaceae bacterium]
MTTSTTARLSISTKNTSDRKTDINSALARGLGPSAPGFDNTAGAAVPTRIREAIARHESVSEIIVGWFQLGGTVLFALLYAASYSAFAVHSRVEPAPVALALYGAFTAWRLRLAYRGALGRRLQYLSVLVDIGVLMLMIWSFPLQYDLPAGLYLKAPTLSYVFILIALRALRFDPLQVAAAGGLAAIGWAGLAAYAGFHGAEITGEYPRYMTSLALLPGAELEKIAAIIAFTAVLALGVARTRALLLRTATEEAAARDLSKFVGRDAAAKIRASSDGVKAGDGELRNAAIMFVDLRGFTPATKGLPAGDVIALLQEYQMRFVPLIEAGGGSVDKFLGDGILVSFGAAARTGRECADAVKTALVLGDEAAAWRRARAEAGAAPLDVCVALAAGEIVYGAIGHGDRLEYTVIGDVVNLAAKLEKHAKVESARLIATQHVVDRARAQGFDAPLIRTRRGAQIDGAAAPVDLAILG